MAIVEAASCGLQVVSTRVGGIPEVLPSNLIYLTDATVDSLYKGVLHVIDKILKDRHASLPNGSMKPDTRSTRKLVLANPDPVLCPYECNEILRKLYNWNDITTRTERVYQRVLKEKDLPFGDKLSCYLKTCIPFVLVVSFSYLLLKFLDIIEPRRYIDIAAEPNHRKKKTK